MNIKEFRKQATENKYKILFNAVDIYNMKNIILKKNGFYFSINKDNIKETFEFDDILESFYKYDVIELKAQVKKTKEGWFFDCDEVNFVGACYYELQLFNKHFKYKDSIRVKANKTNERILKQL